MTAVRWRALLLASLYFAAAAWQIDRPGLQADETLFAQGVYERGQVEYAARAFGQRVPLMQMPYLGSLKSLLYVPVFAVFGESAATVRLPMVLAGAATVALMFLLLWRLRGQREAWLGGALLAADPTFLLTTRCDWGPVAIERLLAVGGVSLFAAGRFGWGALLFGLALWNKTTFLWTLAGLAAGAAVLRPRLERRAVAVAALAFALGAYPWIRYNVSSRGATAQAAANFDASDLPGKARLLGSTLAGTALDGYLYRGGSLGTILPWLALAAGVAAFSLRDRLAMFFTVATVAGWLTMALTRDAGGSAHHAVLLWPWPHCAVALIAARARAAAGLVAVSVLLGAGTIAQQHFLIATRGSDPPWSEAIHALAARVRTERPPGVIVTDWGIENQLLLLTQGSMPVKIVFHRTGEPAAAIAAAHRGWLYASHADGKEAVVDVNERWRSVPGFRRRDVAFLRDRQGNPAFILFTFEPE